jgi:hypothetical protein
MIAILNRWARKGLEHGDLGLLSEFARPRSGKASQRPRPSREWDDWPAIGNLEGSYSAVDQALLTIRINAVHRMLGVL